MVLLWPYEVVPTVIQDTYRETKIVRHPACVFLAEVE